MRKKLALSIDETFAEILDKRVKSLNLTRSEYLRGLILKDLENELDYHKLNVDRELDGKIIFKRRRTDSQKKSS
jgi:hypothetical protein